MSEPKKDALDPVSLVGSIFKFSIATWLNAVMLLAVLFLVNYVFRDDTGVFGLYNLYYTATIVLMNVALLGLDHAYIRFYNEPPDGIRDSRQLASTCMLLSIVFLFVVTLVCSLIFPGAVSALFFEGDATRRGLVVLICVGAFFQMVVRYFNITYRMQLNVKLYSIQSILLQFFSRVFYLFAAVFSKNIETLILFSLIGLGVFAGAFFLLQRRTMLADKWQIERGGVRPLLKYGVALAPNTVLYQVNNLFSLGYVNVMLGSGQLGVYSFLSYLSMALGVIQAGFSTFWSAFIFGNYKQEQRKIRRVHDYLTFIMLCLMAVLIMAQPLIFAIFGTFQSGAPILGFMVYAAILLIISETTVYGILIAKKSYYDSIGTAISVSVNILACLWLVPRMGMAGAAIALMISGIAMFVFRTVIAQRLYRSMDSPVRTAAALALMLGLCMISYAFADRALVVSGSAAALLAVYCGMYRAELKRCFGIAGEVLRSLKKGGRPSEE